MALHDTRLLKGCEEQRLPGIYLLLFRLAEEVEVVVARLGKLAFPKGWYGYVGSGMGGVGSRVRRHLRLHDHPHWHLDYLLPHGTATAVVVAQTPERLECSLAGSLATSLRVFPRFGSSDCRCPGHLFTSCGFATVVKASVDGMKVVGCTPIINLDPTHNPIRLGKLR